MSKVIWIIIASLIIGINLRTLINEIREHSFNKLGKWSKLASLMNIIWGIYFLIYSICELKINALSIICLIIGVVGVILKYFVLRTKIRHWRIGEKVSLWKKK